MKNLITLTTLIASLAALTTRAQLQTLVTGTDSLDTNSAIVTISSNSYVVINSASILDDYNLAVTTQGVTLNFDPLESLVNGFIFSGPATIQVQGNTGQPEFVTLDVASRRKAVGTNIQTLVATVNSNSATINVSSNSFAVINSTSLSGGTLVITLQGVPITYPLADVPLLNGLTFSGPASIQLQGDAFGPYFATVETIRKSSRIQIQTLVVSPSNTNSAVLNVATNNYAAITSFDPVSNATLLLSVHGVPLAFSLDTDSVLLRSNIYAGPASIQFQGDAFNPSFITLTTHK